MVNLCAFPINFEQLSHYARIDETINVIVGVEDDAASGEIFAKRFDFFRFCLVHFFQTSREGLHRLGAVLNLLKPIASLTFNRVC